MVRASAGIAFLASLSLVGGCGGDDSSSGQILPLSCDPAGADARSAIQASLTDPSLRIREVRTVPLVVDPDVETPADVATLRNDASVIGVATGDEPGKGPVLRYVADASMVRSGSGVVIPLDKTTKRLSNLDSTDANPSIARYAADVKSSVTYRIAGRCLRFMGNPRKARPTTPPRTSPSERIR